MHEHVCQGAMSFQCASTCVPKPSRFPCVHKVTPQSQNITCTRVEGVINYLESDLNDRIDHVLDNRVFDIHHLLLLYE